MHTERANNLNAVQLFSRGKTSGFIYKMVIASNSESSFRHKLGMEVHMEYVYPMRRRSPSNCTDNRVQGQICVVPASKPWI